MRLEHGEEVGDWEWRAWDLEAGVKNGCREWQRVQRGMQEAGFPGGAGAELEASRTRWGRSVSHGLQTNARCSTKNN